MTSHIADAPTRDTGKPVIVETAGDFYTQLEEACGAEDNATRYGIVKGVFRRCVEQCVAESDITFTGLFSKVDYCLKEKRVPHTVAELIQAARREMFPKYDAATPPTEEELATDFPHNLKAAALLVYHLYGKAEIPQSLKQRFPKADRKTTWGKFSEKSLRVVVERWDEDFIWATEEENGTTIQVCYGEENTILTLEGKSDWRYLNGVLRQGMQLNLVRLRQNERGTFYLPELIIVEPDYLVNITDIARCFETYAESPYVNLIAKLRPRQSTVPMILGNLAGQMLDDTVHERNVAFDKTIKAFVNGNALSLISSKEFIEGFTRFKEDARVQKRNIEKLVGNDLIHGIDGYDKRGVILEPSFFSEVLGLQGRMDFLFSKQEKDRSQDKYFIIEQKSGKAEFVPFAKDDDVPKAKEQHQVQLLLYRTLFLYGFSKYASQLSILLLYSKYSRGLLLMPSNPRLMHRAIKIRNLIAVSEMRYAKEDMGFLASLTPDALNEKGATGTLWEKYTRQQLAEILAPIHAATDLERAYYLRFLRFIKNEATLSKLGNKTKENSGFASTWHDTLEEKKAAGNIYDKLLIKDYEEDGGGVRAVTLNFGDKLSADTTNFRTGDIVMLYHYAKGTVPDACAQMVFRANIEEIKEDSITLRLRNRQTDKMVFDSHRDMLWAIEHDLIESSADALYSGMQGFLSATKSRRDLILLQREPDTDTTLKPKGNYGSFDTLVTRAKQARDIFLIIGPPGTGKTSYGLVNLLKEELLEPCTNILLLSYTNRAVDEICGKLVEIREKEDPGFDFIRIGSELSCSKEYRKYLLGNLTETLGSGNETHKRIMRTRVFCGTTSALGSCSDIFKLKTFSLAIIDEASQILEPHLMGILSAKSGDREAVRKFVLIGDHKQLPAVVQQTQEESAVRERSLNAIHLTDCRNSLFERFLRHFKTADGYDPRFVYMLTKQGRMHRDIAEFPNIAFYGGKLQVVPLEHQLLPDVETASTDGITRMLATRRIAFVAAGRPRLSASEKTNAIEARMIAATVFRIYQITKGSFDTDQTVGVIVPYRNQISAVRNAIDRYRIPQLHDITIDTVERYQGSQRDYIIYGFTVQRAYQLNFLTNNVFEEDGMVIDRKLNVAMTRARLNLVLIGNPGILNKNYTFGKLMDFIRGKGGYINVPAEDYCNGNFSVPETPQGSRQTGLS